MFGLDPLQSYLISINVIALLAFTLDFLFWRSRNDDKELFNHAFLNIFSILGGGLGMLISFLVWDPRVNKHNVAWRFSAIIGIILWTLALVFIYGQDKPNPIAVFHNLGNDHTVLLTYLGAINVVTLVVFMLDKIRAATHESRFREVVLLGLSLAGGCIGGMVGMYLAHHKTSKYYFKYGLPLMAIVDLIVILYLIQMGIA